MLSLPRGARINQVAERFVLREAAQPTRHPRAQVILHATFTGLTEKAPRFPTRPRKDADVGELIVGILWPVAPAQAVDHADDLTARLKPALDERLVDEVRDQGVRSDEHVRAGYKDCAEG